MLDAPENHVDFELYPAIDLRGGRVVRLAQGDPRRQTTYSDDPAETARRWLSQGCRWLHVVNLDGAFGGSPDDQAPNLQALAAILKVSQQSGAQVQFGGGLRSLESMQRVLEMGVQRLVLGTALVEQPELLAQALALWGAERLAAGIDAQDGLARVRGWQQDGGIPALELARSMADGGLRWLVFTDVSRDGLQSGLNLAATQRIAAHSGMQVIASGGVKDLSDLQAARQAGLAGAIVGKALYEGAVKLEEWYIE